MYFNEHITAFSNKAEEFLKRHPEAKKEDRKRFEIKYKLLSHPKKAGLEHFHFRGTRKSLRIDHLKFYV